MPYAEDMDRIPVPPLPGESVIGQLGPTMIEFRDMIQTDASRWVTGSTLAAAVAFAGYRGHALSTGGALAAIAIGGLIVGAGGWWTGLLLVAFFVFSSALSRSRPRMTPAPGQMPQARGHQRDAVQVVANGGIPVLCAIAGALVSNADPWLTAAASAIAGATADTWATEIGRRSGQRPRSIITWQPLAPGTSGAISVVGTAGSGAGALLIAALAAAGSAADVWIDAPVPHILIVVAIAGFAGSLLDSLLGATLQALWWCPACDVLTESPVHRCGTVARLRRGVAFMNNDLVNAVSITGAGAVGYALGYVRF